MNPDYLLFFGAVFVGAGLAGFVLTRWARRR